MDIARGMWDVVDKRDKQESPYYCVHPIAEKAGSGWCSCYPEGAIQKCYEDFNSRTVDEQDVPYSSVIKNSAWQEEYRMSLNDLLVTCDFPFDTVEIPRVDLLLTKRSTDHKNGQP
jgi:hypothetical protein